MIPIEEYETLESLLENADFGFINKLVADAFHQDGPGRSPRKPLGVFKAHLAKRFYNNFPHDSSLESVRSFLETFTQLYNMEQGF